MTDYISRDVAVNGIAKIINDSDMPEDWNKGMSAAMSELFRIPAADARPVVLCRDCKHKGWVQEPEHGKSVDYCRLIERCVDKQFFCAAGERKTNGGADMRGGKADV